jgi:hypothetical protein
MIMKNIAILIAAGFLLAGCGAKNEEPKAEAQVSVDLNKEKNSLDKALDKAGDEVKKGADEAKAKLDEAGDALKKNAEAAKDKLTTDKHAEIKVEVKK